MTKTIINAADVMNAEEREGILFVQVGEKKREFVLLSNEQCEALKEEAKKVNKALCFIKRNDKVYGSIVPKSTCVRDNNEHRCAKCKLICEKTLEGADVWKYPFIKNAVETVGTNSMLSQFIVFSCSKCQIMTGRKEMSFVKRIEKTELMKELFDGLNQSKARVYYTQKC